MLKKMITTVTPNPALDKTLWINNLGRGECNRVIASRQDPGGKGINIARILKGLNQDVLALGFFGGTIGRGLNESLQNQDISIDPVWINGETRTNIKIIEANQAIVTEINEPGPPVALAQQDELAIKVRIAAQNSSFIVFAGSLPEGCEVDYYVKLITETQNQGCKAVLDTSGPALKASLGASPYLIKPNHLELAELYQTEIGTVQEAVKAAQDLRQIHDIAFVVVSLGSQGAVCISDAGAYYAKPPQVKTANTVGAGDSMVAGLVYGLSCGHSAAEALRFGAAAATLAVMDAATSVSKPEAEMIIAMTKSIQIIRLDE